MNRKTDAVMLEIVGNLLLSIAEEMGVAIIKSAYSNNIKERRDISTAMFDPEGNMVAQAEHVPMHLGSLLGIIGEVFKKFPKEEIHPGDMFIGNDPYNGGGTHLNDITIAAPIFAPDGQLIGWAANLAHHSDIGGKEPGSTCGDAINIFQEGLKIPLVRVCSQGKTLDDIVDFVLCNSRIPGERYGDLQAQIAANRVGARRLLDAYERYGQLLVDCMHELQNYAERRLRAGIQKLPDGEYSFVDYMDDAGVASPDPVKICVKITIKGDDLHVDFAGTQGQVAGPINITRNGMLAAVFYSLKALIDPESPSNAGIYRAFTVDAEPGMILNAKNPAAVGERIDTAMRIADVVFGALAPAAGLRAMAGSNGSCTTALFSGADPKDPERYHVYMETIAGGAGAHRDMDGQNGVQVHMTNTSNLPVEALEMEFPLIIVRKYGLRPDSGGPGMFRGGQGIERVYEAVENNVIYTGLGDRQRFEPWGLEGGQNGAGGCYYLTRAGQTESERLTSKCTGLVINRGDVVCVRTPGAGGWGNAKLRAPEKVLEDVLEKKVSVEAAERCYGVALKGEDGFWTIDEEKTKQLRMEK
ncbi:hydantoinase B/oxoprolinase family protein [Pseudoflavonifractor phocaeensis]|uniref:hydantoinase B/oxoprolinase family protein n=1 Tax=Pseudoflavonifractor phocaeensis TaxID=1870988 RepID=UPI001F28ADB0|nr:hydantoinase B/oxoprolinase family protein [Pseudoflavonifractor phocaeensis]MCF2661554.1 hydantoinase B/oxoprolinase family protein [Pseudoflavonifractor phocaeensis]